MENLKKYRLLKVGKRYVVQKSGMYITPESYGCLVPAYRNETKPVDYDTAIAYIKMWTGDSKVVGEGDNLKELLENLSK